MATKLSLKNPNPGVWFRFDDQDPQSGEVSIRPLNAAKREEIRKKAVKRRIEYKHGQRFEVEDTNDDLFSELLWDYAITEWSGLVDDDGKEIPCTSENKIFLMRNHVGFARFIGDKLELMATEYEGNLEIENKNLSKGSSGCGTPTNQTVKNAGK
jgi:hypothetical protein